MSLPTCAVTVAVYDDTGAPMAGATVTARLDRFEVYNGYVVPELVEVTTAADGTATLNLWPNELGSTESSYTVRVMGTNGKTLRTTAMVPNVSTIALHLIANLPAYEGKSDGQLVIDEAIAAVAPAVAAKNDAQAAAAAADVSADAAAASAVSAASSASTATTQAGLAQTHAGAAQASASAASASASAAAADRLQTGLDAATATTKASAASGSAAAALASEQAADGSKTAAAASALAASGSAAAAAGSAAAALASEQAALGYEAAASLSAHSAEDSADASAASATISQTSSQTAANAVLSQLQDIKAQTEYVRDQAIAGLGAADNSQALSELLGGIAYVTDMALKSIDEIIANRGTVGSTDRAELFAHMFAELLDKIGVIGRAIGGGTIELQAGTAAIPSLMADTDVDTGLFWPAANALGVATGGVERARFTADGRFGLGTNAPSGLLDVNDNKVRVRTAQTPASATAAGNAGEICWDANFIYIAVGTNSWKRVAISSW